MVRRSRAAAFALFVLPVSAWAAIGPAAGSAAAASAPSGDSIAGVQASIATQESKVTAEAKHIHKLTVAYNRDQLRSQNLKQQIASDRRSVSGLKTRVATSKADLRNAAVQAYTNGVSTVHAVPSSNPAVGDEYLSVASGDVDDTVDLLDTQRKQLGSDQARLTSELVANKAAVSGAAKARKQALASAAATQSQIDHLQSRLETLKEQAAAAAAAAENAREAAAAKAEEAKIDAEQTATQGAPVGDGLVTSVQGEVGAGPGPSETEPSSPETSPATGEPPTVDTTIPETTPATAPETSPATDPAPTETPTTVPQEVLATTPPETAPATDPATAAPTTEPLATVPPTTVPPTTVPAAPEASPSGGSIAGDLAELRQCESSDDYTADTGNGFYGAYQFTQSTWSGLGYPGRPDLEPPAMQDEAATQLAETVGWSQWPACSAALGLSGVA